MAVDTTGGAVLARTVEVLWPGADWAVRRGPACRERHRPRGEHVVLPRAGAPRWLLPAGLPLSSAPSPAPGTGVVRRYGALAVSAALRAGAGSWLPRVHVDGAGSSLLDLLAGLLDVDEVAVAVRLGRLPEPRTLVLQAFAPDGTSLCFAKVSLDAAGRASVRAERAGLALAGMLRLSSVAAPPVLYAGRWGGEELVVTRSLTGVRGRGRDAMPLPAMAELAEAGWPRSAPLTDSGWYAGVRRRLEELPAQSRHRLRPGLDVVAAAGGADLPMPLGCWHGDWTPWNMTRGEDRVLLWDWEHAGADVPLGFDPVHHLAQHLRVAAGTGARAERRWLAEARALLEGRLGLDPRRCSLLLVAYLLEVNLRYLSDRRGTAAWETPRAGWGLDLLEHQARSAVRGGVAR